MQFPEGLENTPFKKTCKYQAFLQTFFARALGSFILLPNPYLCKLKWIEERYNVNISVVLLSPFTYLTFIFARERVEKDTR
jgi:hypothetical protein